MAARKATQPRKPATTKKPAKKPAAKKRPAKKRPARPRRTGPAVAALETEFGGTLAPVAGTALAASALALARQLDKPRVSATATASCSRALLDTLDRLRSLVPAEEEKDAVDDLRARHAARRGDRGPDT